MIQGTIKADHFASAKPFPCSKIDWLIDPRILSNAREDVLRLPADGFIRYDSPLERKRVFEGDGRLPGLRDLYDHLQSTEFVEFLRDMTDIPQLQPDRSLYGAGVSVVDRGGKLDLHRDLSIHPKNGLERRLNLAVFLTPSWNDEWGGHLELWSEKKDGLPYCCVRRIRPTWGRIVLFDPSGYHGFPDPLQCPEGEQRISVQLFYYAPARPGIMARERAQFAPRPADKHDPELDKLRLTRAGLTV